MATTTAQYDHDDHEHPISVLDSANTHYKRGFAHAGVSILAATLTLTPPLFHLVGRLRNSFRSSAEQEAYNAKTLALKNAVITSRSEKAKICGRTFNMPYWMYSFPADLTWSLLLIHMVVFVIVAGLLHGALYVSIFNEGFD
jgi:hypothetical protein